MSKLVPVFVMTIFLATGCPGAESAGTEPPGVPDDPGVESPADVDTPAPDPAETADPDDAAEPESDPGLEPEPEPAPSCLETSCPFRAEIVLGDTCTEMVEEGVVGNGGPCGFATDPIEVRADATTIYVANDPPAGGSVFGGIQFDSMEGSLFLGYVSNDDGVTVTAERFGPDVDERSEHPATTIDAGGRSWIAIPVADVVPERGFVGVGAGLTDGADGFTVGARGVRVYLDPESQAMLQDVLGIPTF